MDKISSVLSPLPVDDDLKKNIADGISHSGFTPDTDPTALWNFIRTQVLGPSHPVALHRALADWCFQNWDVEKQGPRPIWQTSEAVWRKTNLHALMQEKGFANFDAAYQWSITEGRQFWVTMIQKLGIPFKNDYRPTTRSLVDLADLTSPKWLPGAKLNMAESCFLADPSATAIIYQKEGEPKITRMTFAELDTMTNRVASALVAHGFSAGDKIAIDMPMNIEAVAIYLGILKLGGTVVCLADSFKAMDIEVRIEVAAPVKAIFTQDITGGKKTFPLYPEVIKAKLCPRAIVVSTDGQVDKMLREQDMRWDDFIAKGSDTFTPAACDAEHAICILFSSSTTSPKEKEGEKIKAPKAIPWQAHTAIKSAVDAHLHHDLRAGKTLCWPTNLGWMMGSFAIFGAFVNRATLAIFNGSAVSAEFVKFVKDANVTVLGLVPTLSEGWEQTKLADDCDWSCVEAFSSTGSPSNPKNYFYLMSRVQGYAPVLEYMGGTEIGGGYLCSTFFHDASPSCFTTPNMGTELFLNDGRLDAPLNEAFIVMNGGESCPPMGLSTQLLNYDNTEKYFTQGFKHPDTGEVLREHGDLVVKYANGFYQSNGRADDGMNLNGIKTSSLDLENYIKNARIDGLKDVAAVAVRPPEGGEDWLVVYATTYKPLDNKQLLTSMKDAIKQNNPQLAKVKDVVVIEALPLTASGKLRRRYLQDLYLERLAKVA